MAAEFFDPVAASQSLDVTALMSSDLLFLGSSGATHCHLFLVPVPKIWGGVFSVMGAIEGGASQTHRTFCYSSKKRTTVIDIKVVMDIIPSSIKKKQTKLNLC